LEKLESKFTNNDGDGDKISSSLSSSDNNLSPTDTSKSMTTVDVKSDDELQPMWKEMESRVVRRKPRTVSESGGRTGRMNIRKTDEEVWLQEGLYDDHDTNAESK
jgi:hypothetical protein